MRQEHRYLLIFAFWIFLWTYFPLIAFPAMIISVIRHFILLRRQRLQAEAQAAAVPVQAQQQWEMQPDPADWWKQ